MKKSDKKIVIATSFICRLNIENWSMHLDLFDFLLSRTRIMKHSVHECAHSHVQYIRVQLTIRFLRLATSANNLTEEMSRGPSTFFVLAHTKMKKKKDSEAVLGFMV